MMNADHAEGSSCGRGQMFELPNGHLLISAGHRGQRPQVESAKNAKRMQRKEIGAVFRTARMLTKVSDDTARRNYRSAARTWLWFFESVSAVDL